MCLLPLLDAPQNMVSLIDVWMHLRPINPATLQFTEQESSLQLIKKTLLFLEAFDYLMLEI